MNQTCIIGLFVALASVVVWGEDVPYPMPKNVPSLMSMSDGSQVKTATDWERVRRPEIVKILEEQEYGVRPIGRPLDLQFSQVSQDESVYGGRAIRKLIRATYSGPYGKSEMTFSAWIPKTNHPVAAFVHSSPRPAIDADDRRAPLAVYWLPVEDIISRGYAVVAYCNKDVAIDWQGGDVPTNGVFAAYGPRNLKNRKPTEWGILSAWAWGMSRVVDWIELEPLIDSKRVAAVGLSRNGKAALVAGAFDTRFAMTVSCCSGCSGAKLNHIDLWESESIDRIMVAEKWFCPNYKQYVRKDKQMPFDQHFLLSLVAPRLLYVSSATEDAWAGQRGEFWSAVFASEAWGLYNKPGFIQHGFPKADCPLNAGSIGYHLRTGMHDITRYDWQCYMDFADGHGWNLP